jgi:hypothetical protein
MDRRMFLGLIPTAVVTGKAMDANYAKNEGPVYKGYRIWEWTGWKPAQGNSVYVGQWLAAPLDATGHYMALEQLNDVRPLLYVSVPGAAESYRAGGTFDITCYEGQKMIERRTTEHVKERERRKGLRRMFRLIDETVKR